MKSFLATLAIASATTASSLLARQDPPCIMDTITTPSQTDIENSINQWNADVNAVNSFLNIALTLSSADLGTHASAALLNAQDEPCQLGTLTNDGNIDGFGTVAAFACAVSDLGAVFGPHVIDNLNTIIQAPDDTAGAHAAVADINFFRCCHVLPSAQILWVDAAEEDGVGHVVNKVPNRPDACASIDCSAVTKCNTLDNGGF